MSIKKWNCGYDEFMFYSDISQKATTGICWPNASVVFQNDSDVAILVSVISVVRSTLQTLLFCCCSPLSFLDKRSRWEADIQLQYKLHTGSFTSNRTDGQVGSHATC